MKADKNLFYDIDAVPGIKASVMSMTSPNRNLGFVFSGQEDIIPYKLDDFRRALMEAFLTRLQPCKLKGAHLSLDMVTYAVSIKKAESMPECRFCSKKEI